MQKIVPFLTGFFAKFDDSRIELFTHTWRYDLADAVRLGLGPNALDVLERAEREVVVGRPENGRFRRRNELELVERHLVRQLKAVVDAAAAHRRELVALVGTKCRRHREPQFRTSQSDSVFHATIAHFPRRSHTFSRTKVRSTKRDVFGRGHTV